MPRQRLDLLLVERGLAPSRQRAQSLILAGKVRVQGELAAKPGAQFDALIAVEVERDNNPFVSRGGLKLSGALSHFGLSVSGKAALDVGASTGGFTDCLLQGGARHVVAVDVGYGQLDYALRKDPRVTVMERTNARYLTPDSLRETIGDATAWPLELAVIDVSFISLTKVLPAVANCLVAGAEIIALVKPQFEAQPHEVGKGGVIRDLELRRRIIANVLEWATSAGFAVRGGIDSSVPGPKGNVEHLVLLSTPG